ncbi:transcriptional regulator [Neisseriaceae bacterium ESL0693]|nr:transcriptional regulator [Neisseriaceae bacterium ESL0693]
MIEANIKLECLRPAARWQHPSGEEVREVLRLAGFTGIAAAKVLGLGAKGDRTVRRWIGEETAIPYAAWALLCEFAGLGMIWREI